MNQQRFGQNNETTCLLVRDTEHNLAVAQDLDEDATNLDLKLAAALTLVGRAQCDGKPITNVTAVLIFWHGRSGMHLREMTLTNMPGQFEIPTLPPGRKYGVVVSAPGYGQKSVFDIGASTDAIRQELDVVELSLANMKLAGQVVDADDKPVAGCNVNINGDGQPSGNARTDREGRFAFEHVCEGAVQISANSQQTYGNITTEGGDTNVVLRLGQTYNNSPGAKTHKLTGVVTDADGKPAAGAQVAVFPVNNGLRWFKTDTNGTYNLNWALESWQTQSGSAILVVRDTARNLAVTAELTEDITNLNVQMKPALTITGQVKSVDDAPLTDAQIDVQIRAGGSGSYTRLNEQLTNAKADGHFEIGLLPTDAKYYIFVSAKNHGRGQIQIEPDPEALRMELPTFVLKIADRVIAGQVLNDKEKPVSGANVSLNGENQPDGNMMTDSKGRFHFQVCEGSIRLFASGQNGYVNSNAEAGDTNIVLTLTSNSGGSRQPPPRAVLKGNPLPDLAGVNLAKDAVPADKPVLLCLFDAGQRPSRFFIRQLNEKSPALQQKNISIVGVQAAITSDETFNDWMSTSPVSFPIGRVTEKTDKSKWASSVNTFPWLILTDARHQVIAEGFAFDELDAQIAKLAK
jgi:protocatechuate 3,4-dioxygenase beta subunit